MGEKELFGFTEEEAKRIAEELKKYTHGVIEKVSTKVVEKPPPPLHSLTTLQREANKLYGYSAKKTLDIAQTLYEKLKLISYPRTESKHLSPADRKLVLRILEELEREDLKEAALRAGKRVFDASKVADHHAIIPLKKAPAGLGGDEKRIYDLVLRRFLAAFYPPYVYKTITLLVKVGKKYHFLARFKEVLQKGWKELYDAGGGEEKIPTFREGEKVKKLSQKVVKKKTQPPPRYTEGALLKEMERLGLGTPATRAQIIETLKKRGYLTRKGKTLLPTQKAFELIEKVKTLPVSSPEMTAEWERELEKIHLGRLGYKGYKTFMEKIKRFTAEGVEKLKKTP